MDGTWESLLKELYYREHQRVILKSCLAVRVRIECKTKRVFPVKSTLVELPPEDSDLEESAANFISATSVEELAEKTLIGNETVLNRVLLPGRLFGPYLIRGFVAAGGMGEIYAAQRLASDGRRSRPLALKVIAAEYANDWRIIERFKREARISKAISSPHVTKVYEFGESPEGHAFLSMELLSGEELFEKLSRHKMLTPLETAHITLQILEGLHTIHTSGFVHRDIKPENIYLTRTAEGAERVKILDFGIAKRQDQRSDPLLSVAGQVYGTPQYLAPEQAISPDVDSRADLYSLGVLMYEAVAGNLPFDRDTPYALILAHQSEAPPALPSTIDPEFEQIVFRALAKRPEDRYQSAQEMASVLTRWVEEGLHIEDLAGQQPGRRSYLTPFLEKSSVPFILTDMDFDDSSEESLPGMQDLPPSRRSAALAQPVVPAGEVPAGALTVGDEQGGEDDEQRERRAHQITRIAMGIIALAIVWAVVTSLMK